jgi:hypothetical protein
MREIIRVGRRLLVAAVPLLTFGAMMAAEHARGIKWSWL